MKLNLLIRTYIVNNLYISLFDIPSKILPNIIEIYVHNDNPNEMDNFESIISEFRNKYPLYIIHTISEHINQDMFMSYFNSIEYFNNDNYWTMILDDDDSLCKFDNNIIVFLNNYIDKKVCIKYKIFSNYDNIIKSDYFVYHRIYPTYILKQIYGYKELIINLLYKHNKSTKFNLLEDKLMMLIVNSISKLHTINYDKELVNYNIYYHNVNGYEKVNAFNLNKHIQLKCKINSIINNIIKNLNEIIQNEKIL